MSENNKLESTLWKTADKLRNNMDAAEYKHVVLGLIFLKYISDSFDDLYKKLKTESSTTGADPEDKMNIPLKGFSMSHPRQDGPSFRTGQNSPLSAKMSMMQWMPLKKIILP